MSLLLVGEPKDFITLRNLLDVTDGNLASHLKVLEDHQYLRVRKEFVGRKPVTSYIVTATGRKAFQDHLSGLEILLRQRP